MTFNDESLARAVADCPVPVVTGIGHEPDTCICDMVADRRSSTPTAAAESVAPAIDEVVTAIEGRRQRMGAALQARVSVAGQQADSLLGRAGQAMQARLAHERTLLEAFAQRRCLEDPLWVVEDRVTQLMQSEQRLHDAMPRTLERATREVDQQGMRLVTAGDGLVRPHEALVGRMAASLEALSPLKVLSRGYAIALDDKRRVVSDAAQLSPGQDVSVVLGAGSFDASVSAVHPARNED